MLLASTDVVSGPTFQAGTYALSESGGPTGYTASAWSCVKNNAAPVIGSNITLGLGDSAVCTITNNDNKPSLTLDKIVVNDNGGTALESAWTLTANGGTAGTLAGSGAAGNTDVVSGPTFQAGTYALSESGGPTGYTASAWSCVKNNAAPVIGSNITLGLGDSAVCTITNNDMQAGTIDARQGRRQRHGRQRAPPESAPAAGPLTAVRPGRSPGRVLLATRTS